MRQVVLRIVMSEQANYDCTCVIKKPREATDVSEKHKRIVNISLDESDVRTHRECQCELCIIIGKRFGTKHDWLFDEIKELLFFLGDRLNGHH